jgi:hypothetical protein
MDINQLLNSLFEVCLIPAIAVLTSYFVKWVRVKAEELKTKTQNEIEAKYIDMLQDTITKNVIAINQTYVDALKDKNAFDLEAQKQAFEMVYKNVIASLNEEAYTYLNEAIGDLQGYITTLIEASVKENKKNKGESLN